MDELQNKLFISTQPEDGFPELKKHLADFTLINFPTIEVSESEITLVEKNIIKDANSFDWLIFTSKNGVYYFLKKFQDITGFSFKKDHVRIAVIGKKTAKEFQNKGIEPDYISESNLAEKFVVELKENVIQQNTRILLLLGNLASGLLETTLSDIADIKRINCYQTSKAKVKNTEALERIFSNDYELIIFTSSSGFENFISLSKDFNIDIKNIRVVSIGKSTTKTMNDYGVQPVFTAQQSNLEGIANELKNIYKLKA